MGTQHILKSITYMALLAFNILGANDSPVSDSEKSGVFQSIKPAFGYVSEATRLLAGGSEDTDLHHLDNIDLQFEFDTKVAGLWQGGTLFAYVLSNRGFDPSGIVGDAQVTSNIEANNSSRLYEFWYNQALMDGRLNVAFGLHDLNRDFYTSEPAGFFNNSSFGIGADVAGSVPVSIFNITSHGVRLSYAPTEKLTILAAVYDGDPGDPDVKTHSLKFDWKPEQGFMTISEAQYAPNAETSTQVFRIGTWYHTADFASFKNPDKMLFGNYGVYTSIDQPIGDKLDTFFRLGVAASDRSAIKNNYSLGLQTVPGSLSIITEKLEQSFGLGLTVVELNGASANEMTIEAAWSVQVTDYLGFKPDLQYVINPSGDTNVDGAMIFSLRTEIGF